MKKGAKVSFTDDMEANFDFLVDHKDTPDMVLDVANRCLKKHGLEFISHDSDYDFYAFSIRKIRPRRTAKKG